MKVESFEDLRVWQRAKDLAKEIYLITQKGKFAKELSLKSQIQRAAVSIASNIAEGFERGSKTEFIQFLYIAKGSAGEVRTQLHIAREVGLIPQEEFDRLNDLVRTIGGMLFNLIQYLKSSKIKGEKFKQEP